MQTSLRAAFLLTCLSFLGLAQAQTTVYDANKGNPLNFFNSVETGVGLADRVILGGTDRALSALHFSLFSTDSLATGTFHAEFYEPDLLGGPGALFASSSILPFSTTDLFTDFSIPGAAFGIGPVVLPEEFYVGLVFDSVSKTLASILSFSAIPEGDVTPGSNPAESYYRSTDGGASWFDGALADSAIPFRIEAIAVPEASTWALAAGALALAALLARRR